MGKILLGWEYGGGFGHIRRLVFLGEALQKAGHSVVIAVSKREATRPVWEGKAIDVVAAPVLKGPPIRRTRSGTFADVLEGMGTFTPERLIALGKGWESLLAEIEPDVVICESSPHLALQTLGRIPTIAIGTGYCVPPAGRPFPPLRFWVDGSPEAESVQNEEVILNNLNTAAASLGLDAIEYVADVFNGDDAFVCCLPELDCYKNVRRAPAIGDLDIAAVAPRTNAGNGIFAYLPRRILQPGWRASRRAGYQQRPTSEMAMQGPSPAL